MRRQDRKKKDNQNLGELIDARSSRERFWRLEVEGHQWRRSLSRYLVFRWWGACAWEVFKRERNGGWLQLQAICAECQSLLVRLGVRCLPVTPTSLASLPWPPAEMQSIKVGRAAAPPATGGGNGMAPATVARSVHGPAAAHVWHAKQHLPR